MSDLVWYWLTGREARQVFISFGVMNRVDVVVPLPVLWRRWWRTVRNHE